MQSRDSRIAGYQLIEDIHYNEGSTVEHVNSRLKDACNGQ
jgi:hypothetical protein